MKHAPKYFYCAVCKTAFCRACRENETEHCGYPAHYLGSGHEGSAKARQMNDKDIRPLEHAERWDGMS